MVKLYINGLEAKAEEGQTVLEVARWLGIEIPTLCHYEGLSLYGACRLCLVEIGNPPWFPPRLDGRVETGRSGGGKTRLVTSCLYPVKEGLYVRTHSERVVKVRKMLMELLLARCPGSKKLQDMAAKMGLTRVRFKPENKDCILCGLCVRMCEEQMQSGAIGFSNRGTKREVTVPFRQANPVCRNCGACMYICPVVEMRCQATTNKEALCSGCLNFEPVCLETYPDVKCFLEVCGACVPKK